MNDQPSLDRLAEHLRVLGNPNRLKLLYELRRPQSVSDLELAPEKVAEGENPDRPISHQAVRGHLAKLDSIGVIATERRERDGHILDEYVLDHQRLFAIVEELRSLGELKAEKAAPTGETIVAGREASTPSLSGPRLMVVRGQREGRIFPLEDETLSADRGWVIGRKRGLAVSLDYDPFVSEENSEVLMNGNGFEIVDMEASQNGTFVNYEKLPSGGSKQIDNGDVISVGRTSLVFRTD